MPRVCTVCDSPHRDTVDRELVAGRSMHQIALMHPPISEWAVARHRDAHLTPAIVAVNAKRHQRGAERLVDRVERIVTEAETILASAKDSGKVSSALAAIRELRSTYELLGRLTGELKPDSAVTVVNVQQDPGWLELRSRLLTALAPYPDARDAVISALSGADGARSNDAPRLGSGAITLGPSVDRDGQP